MRDPALEALLARRGTVKQIAAAFQVRGIPALFLMKDGEVVDSWTGYSPRAAVKQRLETHVGKLGA